jgi:ABC-type lipoprotein release transport system permease subunit
MLLRLAWRNLWRAWRRSAIVLVAIAVGLAAGMLLVSWSRGMFDEMAESAIELRLSHLAITARGYQDDPDPARSLPGDAAPLRDLVAAVPGARPAARLAGEGLIQSSRSALRVALLGVDPRAEAAISAVPHSLVAGSWLPPAATRRVGRALPSVVIGAAMAERLQVGVGDKVVIHVAGEGGLAAYRVAGIYRVASSEFERAYAFLRLGDAQALLGRPGAVTEIAINLEEPGRAREVQERLRAGASAAWPEVPVDVLRWQEREPRLATLLDMIRDTSWILYAAVFIAMAFGIANVLLMSIYERTREFGVLRALGMKGSRLLVLVLLEALLLTLLGTALGLAAALPVVAWLGSVGLDLASFSDALRELGVGTRIRLRLGPEDVVRPIVIAAITALVAAFWPALRAVRLRPTDALRKL